MTRTTPEGTQLIMRSTLALAISTALAAQAQAQDQTENENLVMEEILVTATKRAEDMQDIPIAVTAVTGEQIAELQIGNILDGEKTVPGMKVRYVGADPHEEVPRSDQLPQRVVGLEGGRRGADPYGAAPIEQRRHVVHGLIGRENGGVILFLPGRVETDLFVTHKLAFTPTSSVRRPHTLRCPPHSR